MAKHCCGSDKNKSHNHDHSHSGEFNLKQEIIVTVSSSILFLIGFASESQLQDSFYSIPKYLVFMDRWNC